MIIVLIGPHGVGKSSLGAALAARTGLLFDAEIGRAMAEDPAWRPAGATAADAAGRFDEELFRRETARDARRGGLSRIIETWHPGNLAFAADRSPTVAEAWRRALLLDASQVLVQPLIAPEEVLAARQTEPGDLAFFRRVGANALAEAQRMGLRCLPALDTHAATPAQLAERVTRRMARQTCAPAQHLTLGA